MVDVYKVDLTKDQLSAMPDDERGFFFFMGLAANEISCFSKLIIMTVNVKEESKIVDHAHTSQAFMLLRVLYGKCYEALKFLKHSQIAARYKPSLPTEIQQVRRSLDRNFEQGGVLEDIRNISFHYPSSDELNSAF